MNKLLLYGLPFLSMVPVPAYGQYVSEKGWFEVDNVRGCPGLTVNISYTALSPCICFTGIPECICVYDYEGNGMDTDQQSFTYNVPGNYRLEVAFPDPDGSDFIDIEIKDPALPAFAIYQCGGNSVQIDISDNNFDNYVINYGDGFEETVAAGSSKPSHTYVNSVSRTITVRGLDNNALDNCSSAGKAISPLPVLPPPNITSLTIPDAAQLEITYNNPPDILYQLYIRPNNSGSWQRYGNKFSNTSTEQLNVALDLINNFYCFRLSSFDPCNNVELSTSNVICSVDLDLAVESNVNRLSWNTSNPDISFTLKRSDLLDRPFPPSTLAYDDRDIDCGVEYCYTLVANYTGGYTSSSLTLCGIAFSDKVPDPIDNISTVVNDNSVQILWETPAGAETLTYPVQRRENNTFNVIATIDNTTYNDDNLSTGELSYCYQIGSNDACGNNNNESITACSILLSGVVDYTNTIQLTWNAYSGYSNGVKNYIIEKSYSDGSIVNLISNSSSFQETDNNNSQQLIQYRVRAVPNDNVPESSSNTVSIIKPNNIFHPTAFTPDNNRLNETFKVKGKYITQYELRIYNRWGELIFVSDNMDVGWDGQHNGRAAPIGTYAFTVEMVDMAGRKIKEKGSVLLLKSN